ncbi:MAG TPA: M57 family metalloprotease [Longimicrobium sp.]|jgi:hypothetical protein|uniref:M57 family metalloprotease n=1 Tax=Longimicrobium sp. TaxID=2029185 RepID=UPI002EDA1FDF
MLHPIRSHAAYRAAVLLLAGTLAACSDAPTAALDGESLLARQVAALGFRADMIEEYGDFVLVEGDIYLSRAQLRSVPLVNSDDPLRPSFQYRTTNLVGSPKVHDIRVDVSGLASQPDWQAAAREALTHWSGIANSYVRMVEGGPADITVATTCTSSNVAAFASFPSSGNPGSTVFVNTCFGFTTNHAQRVHNMVHELGHTLGFRHSNYTQMGETASTVGAVHVYGTPTSGNAAGSVMNGGTALNQWTGLSANDITATVRLYPLPAVTGATSTDAGGQVRLSWNAIPGAISYNVQRVEERTEDDFYANTVTTTVTEGPWLGPITAIPFDTGSPWTGVTSCVWSMAWQTSDVSAYFYRIIANFPNGNSVSYVSVYANDATC